MINTILLNRSEMKNLKAGNLNQGSCYIECDNCNNPTCSGWADDCVTGVYQICGPGHAGQSFPPAICVC